jgi:hypothetical protein
MSNAEQTVAGVDSIQKLLPSVISGCPDLMTPNQPLQKFITDFTDAKNQIFLGRTALIENNS